MITFENDKEIRCTVYMSVITLSDVAERLNHYIMTYEDGYLSQYELIDMKMSAGLPRGDYGQTVNLRFSKSDFISNLEKNNQRPDNQAIVGS